MPKSDRSARKGKSAAGTLKPEDDDFLVEHFLRPRAERLAASAVVTRRILRQYAPARIGPFNRSDD